MKVVSVRNGKEGLMDKDLKIVGRNLGSTTHPPTTEKGKRGPERMRAPSLRADDGSETIRALVIAGAW